jgi:diguanylate cyclase (GGDEF)-like protein
MGQQGDDAASRIGLYLNPVGQRRADFQRCCGEQFSKLYIADGTEQAMLLLAQDKVDLLVIDLDRFERSLDLAAIGALVERRAGAPTLVIVPFTSGGWLASLLPFGPIEYAVGPLGEGALQELVAAQFLSRARAVAPVTTRETELRALLAVRERVQQTLADADDLSALAENLCEALCTMPGVVHAALFDLKGAGDLQLEAQYAPGAFDIVRILHRNDRLLQSPLRHAFPGLLAAVTGEVSWLDAPEKAGEPELAQTLHDCGIAMVLGLPILAAGAAVPRGSLCLMFSQPQRLSPDHLAALAGLAQLAAYAMRMAEMNRETEHLLARLTHLATTDALTGVANRRHGEGMLEDEIKRSRRYKVPVALICFDIDHFKAINDRYGHPVGDAALRSVAAIAQSVLRTSDILVRSGGQDFQIIAPHTSAIDALKMAEKIRTTIAQSDIAGCDRLTISLGVGQAAEMESADALTLRVETAMSRAKRAGRNCVELAMQ